MPDFYRRIGAPLLVFVLGLAVLEVVHLLVTPVVVGAVNRVVNAMIPLEEYIVVSGNPADGTDGTRQRVLRSWIVSDRTGTMVGLVCHVRTNGYSSPVELIIGVSLDGDLWDIRMLSAFESASGYRALQNLSAEIDTIAGATITVNAVRDSIGVVREEAARLASSQTGEES